MRSADYAAFAEAVNRRRRRNRLRLSGTPVLVAEEGVAYDGFTVTVAGRYTGTLVYSAAGLPTGIEIDDATGEVAGTPTETGSFKVDISVRDALYRVARLSTFTLVVS